MPDDVNTVDRPTRMKPMPTPEAQKTQMDFAARLEQKMKAKGLTQSELARQIWGSTKDGRGYSVARNRDRISSYLAGAGMPEPENLKKLADALDCTVEDLIGAEAAAAGRPLRRQHIDVQMALVSPHAAGEPPMMQVQINMVLPLRKAMQMLQIIEESRSEIGGGGEGGGGEMKWQNPLSPE